MLVCHFASPVKSDWALRRVYNACGWPSANASTDGVTKS